MLVSGGSSGSAPSLRPGTRTRNRMVSTDDAVPALLAETSTGFGVGAEFQIAGDANARMKLLNAGILRGQLPDATRVADLQFLAPPSGATAVAGGAWAHRGDRITDLGWRNVKHWGATGDGSTGDKAAIQACINAGSGVVYFPPGTYMLEATTTLPSNVRLVGAGPNRTIIRAAASLTRPSTMFNSVGLSGWTVSTQVSNVVIADLSIDGNAAARSGASDGHLIWFRGPNSAPCDNLVFRNLRLYNAPAMALPLQNCNRVLVSGCYISDCGRDGVSFWGNSAFNRVEGCLIQNTGDDAVAFNATALDASSQNVLVDMRDNTVVGNVLGPGALTSWSDGGGGNGVAVNGGRRMAIIGNTIPLQIAAGIRLSGFKTNTTTPIIDVVIAGNVIDLTDNPVQSFGNGDHGNGIAISTGASMGMGGTASTYPNIARILVSGNCVFSARGHGIWVSTSASGGSVDNLTIANNIIDGNGGSGQDSNSSGILVAGDSYGSSFNGPRSAHYAAPVTPITDVDISGNRVSRYAQAGIYLRGVTRPTVQHNQAIANGRLTAAAGITMNACADYIVAGNRARNVSGGAGQTYGVELIGGSGTNWTHDNMLVGNATAAINRSSLTGTNRIWHNEGDTVAATPPPF